MKNVDVGDPVVIFRNGVRRRQDICIKLTAGIMFTGSGMKFSRRTGGSVSAKSPGWHVERLPGYEYSDQPAAKTTTMAEHNRAQYHKAVGIREPDIASAGDETLLHGTDWEKLFDSLSEEDFNG